MVVVTVVINMFDTHFSVSDNGVIPLLPQPSLSRSRRVQQRQSFPSRTIVNLANQSITALNDLATSFPSAAGSTARRSVLLSRHQQQQQISAPIPFVKHLPQSSSRRVHQRVYSACQRYCRQLGYANDNMSLRGDHPQGHSFISSSLFKDIDRFTLSSSSSSTTMNNNNQLHYTAPPPAKLIIAAKVSLPAAAGTCNLVEVAHPSISAQYADPSLLLRPKHEVKLAHKAFLCPPAEYRALLIRMKSGGMLSFTQSPKCINGLFGVAKGEQIRLIIDCRPVNSLLIDSPHVALPTPDLIAKLQLQSQSPVLPRQRSLPLPHQQQSHATLYAAKVDLSDYYHRIRMPSTWWDWFALPPVLAGEIGGVGGYANDALVYPCITTLPMGFSHAVYLAQHIHEHIINTRVPLLSAADRIRPPSKEDPTQQHDYQLNRMRHSVYIDDLNIYGTDRVAMEAAQQQYVSVMIAAGLPPKSSKIVAPTSSGLECLGVMVNGNTGEGGVAVHKLHKLRNDTLSLLHRGVASGDELSKLVGRFIWCMLVRRPSLSIFSATYRYILVSRHRSFTLWPSVRKELYAAAMITPLLFTSIRVSFIPKIIASDASEYAQGVVAATINPQTCIDIISYTARPEVMVTSASGERDHFVSPLLSSTVSSSNWRTIVSKPWQQPEHINVLEVRAALTAVRHSLTLPSSIQQHHYNGGSSWYGHRVLLCSDSSSALGALNKGRTSSYTLLRPLRTISALLLASGVQLSVVWLPSQSNPADGPSRYTREKERYLLNKC